MVEEGLHGQLLFDLSKSIAEVCVFLCEGNVVVEPRQDTVQQVLHGREKGGESTKRSELLRGVIARQGAGGATIGGHGGEELQQRCPRRRGSS